MDKPATWTPLHRLVNHFAHNSNLKDRHVSIFISDLLSLDHRTASPEDIQSIINNFHKQMEEGEFGTSLATRIINSFPRTASTPPSSSKPAPCSRSACCARGSHGKIKPIRSDDDLNDALKEIDRIWNLPEEKDKLEVLSFLAKEYERKKHPIPKPSWKDKLVFRLDQSGWLPGCVSRLFS